jgi:hypothetical protein
VHHDRFRLLALDIERLDPGPDADCVKVEGAARLERFHVRWNRLKAATAARRLSGAPAQARTLRSAAVSENKTWSVSI